MLSKENRLKRFLDFKNCYNNSKSVSNQFIVLYIGKLNLNKSNPTRVGFVVSKKVDKRAVVRNTTKRKLREATRLIIKNNMLPLDNFENIIILARKSLTNIKTQDIIPMIIKLFGKINY